MIISYPGSFAGSDPPPINAALLPIEVAPSRFLLRVEISVSCKIALLDQLGDQRGPALVAGAQAASVLAVEVLKEEQHRSRQCGSL